MYSNHPVHIVHPKQIILLIVACIIDLALMASFANHVFASDAPSPASSLNYDLPNVGIVTTTTVTSSQNSSRFGQTVTFTATVDAGTLVTITSGVVTFTIDSNVFTRTLVAGAPATSAYLTSSLGVGTHTVHVDYFDETGSFNSSSADLSPNQIVNRADTTTTLSTSGTPSVSGQSVTLTATVSAMPPGIGTPTGTVQFYNNGTLLGGAQTLAGGLATLVTTTLSVGAHPITATYSGNPSFNVSSSGIVTQTVNPANTTNTLVTSGSPSVFGQSVTLTATVSATPPGAGTPTGTVQFYDSGSSLGGAQTLVSGSATLITTTLSVGSHPITATYSGSPSFNVSTASATTQTVNKGDTTTTLTAAGTSSVFGQSVTFTATVSATPPSSGIPAGTVQFYNNGALLGGAQTLASGLATLATTSLSVGSHSITATYSGNPNFNVSTASTVTQTVNPANTTTALVTSGSPSIFGQSVILTATVSILPPGVGTPTGTVQFFDNGSLLGGAQTLASGLATLVTTTLSVGSHPMTASYAGSPNFNVSTSGIVTQTVNRANTTVVLSASPNPSTYQQSVDITATVTSAVPGAGTPTGTVAFKSDGGIIGAAVPLIGGSAKISTSTLPSGSHAITADYSGDGSFNLSTGTLSPNQTVNKAATLTSITGYSPNPSVVGQSVTVTFTVLANNSFGGIPTGNVVVTDGVSSCTGTVAEGKCQLNLTIAGTRYLSATYQGDSNFAASPPTVGLAETVNKADTTATITANSPNISIVGQPVTITFSVAVNSPGSGSPTGNVVVSDGVASCIGTVAVGKCQIAFTLAGTKTLRAAYQGDNNLNPSAPSAGTTQTVNPRDTTTSVSASTNPSVYGQSAVFSATVSTVPAGFGTPTGTVQFKVDGNNLGSPIPLSGASAIISTTALAVGTHTITAVSSGDANFNPSSGNLFPNQVVNKANTTTTITSQSPNPSLINQTVTVQFTVMASPPGSGLPTGNVTVTNGTNNCSAAVAVGNCQILFTSTTNKTLTASYGGDNNFNSSTSAPVIHQFWSPYIYLPMILKGWPPSGPKPGAWKGPTNDEFNVSPNRDSIQGFAIYVNIPSCNISNYRITHTTPEPIINNHFSFAGSFYADVIFDSETTAHGYDGLDNFTVPGCVTGSGGPWNFTATWQSDTPIPFSLSRDLSRPNIAEAVSPGFGFQRTITPK